MEQQITIAEIEIKKAGRTIMEHCQVTPSCENCVFGTTYHNATACRFQEPHLWDLMVTER